MTDFNKYLETELVALLRQGDRDAFTEIYNRHHKGIYGYLLGFVKEPAHAEDLVHEVFMKIWEIHPQLEIHSNFSSYIYRIAHNKAINALRKIATDIKMRSQVLQFFQRDAGAITTVHFVESNSAADSIDNKYYDQLFQDALNALPTQRRKVFELCRQEGRSYDETAAELGISRNTVKDHMTKAMKSLQIFIAEKGEIAFALIVVETFLK